MRVGDCSLEIVPVGGGSVRELPSGHVLARPGQVYLIRLRNHGPLRAVAEVSVDGRPVSGGGLVLDPRATVELERPIHATENGRFTVVAEGDEAVFGPDGGRDNERLGLIEVRFRRELPRPWASHETPWERPALPMPRVDPTRPLPPRPGIMPPGRPMAPPEWSPPWLNSVRPMASAADGGMSALGGHDGSGGAYLAGPVPPEIARPASGRRGGASRGVPPSVERAAGTGLTGRSDQRFRAVQVGELEEEATVLRLRLVIGDPEAIEAARPLPDAEAAPARPAARP